ncbi:MAG: amidase [Salinirussus sp.]
MVVREPSADEIRKLGEELHFDLTEEEVHEYHEMVRESLGAYETIRSYNQPHPREPTSTRRDSGQRARPESDPYNSWITRCSVLGADDGALAGWEVGLKDNICLAGVEMTCGSQVLEGYTPNLDATIVTRLLDAGADIVGKTNMDDMAMADTGGTSAFGPVLNPADDDHLAGGSSAGSASAVAAGEVDMAIGGDQGGSVRVPASWCGIVGHKPTHGLVPYTGIVGLENTIDHIGIFTQDVERCARSLGVLAGKDPLDPRQPETVPTEEYAATLSGEVTDLSIAVVDEGFNHDVSETRVNNEVRAAIDEFEDRGATVESVSVPMHADASDIYFAALAEGLVAAVNGEGLGHNWKGWYNLSWLEGFGKARRVQGGDLPPTVKLTMLIGAYMSDQYHSKYYAEAMNLRRELTKRYEEVLGTHDLVAMPATPQTAIKYEDSPSRTRTIERVWDAITNSLAFNMTGHPSVSVPVDVDAGLPVGLLLTGSHFDDGTVLDAAYAYEHSISG